MKIYILYCTLNKVFNDSFLFHLNFYHLLKKGFSFCHGCKTVNCLAGSFSLPIYNTVNVKLCHL